MSGGRKDAFLSNLLFLYFFQKPVRASAEKKKERKKRKEKKNAFSSNLWACLDDCCHLYVFFSKLLQSPAAKCENIYTGGFSTQIYSALSGVH